MKRARNRRHRSTKRNQERRRGTKTGRSATRHAKARNRALHVLADVRRGVSFTAAASARHISSKTALKYIGNQLRRVRGKSKYVAIKSDRSIRNMLVLTPLGHVPVAVRGSKEASLLGKYSAAVQKFLRSGDDSVLTSFSGKRVAGHELITDPNLLSTLADAGALRLDDLYAVPTRAA